MLLCGYCSDIRTPNRQGKNNNTMPTGLFNLANLR